MDITDADSIGENLVDMKFFIVITTDPTNPLPVNSSVVSEAFELANVHKISDYTVSYSTHIVSIIRIFSG